MKLQYFQSKSPDILYIILAYYLLNMIFESSELWITEIDIFGSFLTCRKNFSSRKICYGRKAKFLISSQTLHEEKSFFPCACTIIRRRLFTNQKSNNKKGEEIARFFLFILQKNWVIPLSQMQNPMINIVNVFKRVASLECPFIKWIYCISQNLGNGKMLATKQTFWTMWMIPH